MISSYLAGVPKEEQAEVKAEYESAFRFRKRLLEKLEKEVATEITAMLGVSNFNANEQLERLARIKTLKKIQLFLK